jgi:hypothetical protein
LTQEIERTELLEPGDSFWEAATSEWSEGHAQALRGHLRCARAASKVERRYGEKSLERFASDVGAGKSSVYEHAGWWERSLERFGSEEAILARFESSPLRHWQAIEAMKGEPEILDRAEDENLSVRAIKRLVSGEEEKNAETVELCCCPKCGEVYPMSEAMTWTDTR